jgi:hypothetical protein
MIVPVKTNTGTKTLIDSYKEFVPTFPLLTGKGRPRGVFESGGHHPPSRPLIDPCNFAGVLRRVPGNALVSRAHPRARDKILARGF